MEPFTTYNGVNIWDCDVLSRVGMQQLETGITYYKHTVTSVSLMRVTNLPENIIVHRSQTNQQYMMHYIVARSSDGIVTEDDESSYCRICDDYKFDSIIYVIDYGVCQVRICKVCFVNAYNTLSSAIIYNGDYTICQFTNGNGIDAIMRMAGDVYFYERNTMPIESFNRFPIPPLCDIKTTNGCYLCSGTRRLSTNMCTRCYEYSKVIFIDGKCIYTWLIGMFIDHIIVDITNILKRYFINISMMQYEI